MLGIHTELLRDGGDTAVYLDQAAEQATHNRFDLSGLALAPLGHLDLQRSVP